MKKIAFILLAGVFAAGIASCKHTVDFNEYPTVSFSSEILPTIIGNCTQAKCHGTNDSEAFMLLSYEDIMNNTRVKAGDPEGSKLYKVIKALSGEEKMPRDPYPMLSDEQIQKIYVWIGQGAQNN